MVSTLITKMLVIEDLILFKFIKCVFFSLKFNLRFCGCKFLRQVGTGTVPVGFLVPELNPLDARKKPYNVTVYPVGTGTKLQIKQGLWN